MVFPFLCYWLVCRRAILSYIHKDRRRYFLNPIVNRYYNIIEGRFIWISPGSTPGLFYGYFLLAIATIGGKIVLPRFMLCY